MIASLEKTELFDKKGDLRLKLFDPSAKEVLDSMKSWLVNQRRRMFLPLDLMIVLVERANPTLIESISQSAESPLPPDSIASRLRMLSSEIEEESSEMPPVFNRNYFSRGLTRILSEAYDVTHPHGALVTEADLVRCLLWRAEATESASIRWAIRRLGEGGGDKLFDDKGLLREDIFSDSTWEILQGSMRLAASQGTPFLGTPHLIAMLCAVPNSTIWRSAKARGFEPKRLREEMLRLIGSHAAAIPPFLLGRKTLTPRMVRMLAHSSVKENTVISEPDLMAGFLEDGGSSLELVQALGLESELRRALGEPKVLEEIPKMEMQFHLGSKSSHTPTLDMIGRDLTIEAMEGKLPHIVGREQELQRVVNILLRREQRNPLLTGEAGVGKTALAMALAQRIASGQVPKLLRNHRVVEINGANLMSGTSYRGDLESRIKGLLEEAREEVILFIDEAHAVFAPRAGSHAPAEVPNHFKSALASGDIAVVAATTEAEYRRWIEQDPALKRRFERVEVEEPSRTLVTHILSSLISRFEQDYEVHVAPDALESAIDLSMRFMPEQRLPDKAKKLLMDACIARTSTLSLESEGTAKDPPDPPLITREDVAGQVHLKTKVPLERLLRGEIHWWVGIEDRLAREVIGQPQAIATLAKALISGRLRASTDHRPMAVMLFAGPAGVGKGTLCRALAKEVFGSEKALIRLDMTDFQEAHAMSRLVGSPPGYVGYEDEDLLVTPLRRRPSSVVVLDDFDRAHLHIQERLLRMLSEGAIADTRGYRADVRNAIFILTMNVETKNASRIGFSETSAPGAQESQHLREAIEKRLPSKMRDLMDAVVEFEPMGSQNEEATLRLLDQRIDHFVQGMRQEYKIQVTLTPQMLAMVRQQTLNAHSARALIQITERFLFDPITHALLAGSASDSLTLDWDKTTDSVCVRDTGQAHEREEE